MGLGDILKKVRDRDDDLFDDEEDRLTNRSESEPKLQSQKNKIVNINTTAQLQVVIVKPEKFDDAAGIADHLLDKRTVVLNLETTSKEVSYRLVDFLSGVAYANGGQIKRVANKTFIITPYNVDLIGDLIDELESSGIFF